MQVFNIHPHNPQKRLVTQVVTRLQQAQIGAIPTDSGYALVSSLDNAAGRQRIIQLRGLETEHPFSLLCGSLDNLAIYANVNNANFKLIKSLIPGPYTFILPSTREVPKKLSHPKRKTIGVRVPKNNIVHALVNELQEPVMSVSLAFIELAEEYKNSCEELADYLKNKIDFFVEAGDFVPGESTVIDCCQDEPEIIRQGIGIIH